VEQGGENLLFVNPHDFSLDKFRKDVKIKLDAINMSHVIKKFHVMFFRVAGE